jgi:hypothetical protein
MSHNRPTLVAGIGLILLGVVFLISTIYAVAWPVILIGIGLITLFVAVAWHIEGLVSTALVNITLGGILLYQTLTQNWASWYYLWPLIFSAVGAGMLVSRTIAPAVTTWRSARYLRVSAYFLVFGLIFTAVLWTMRGVIGWPSILWGMGLLFFLAAPVSGIAPLVIPGAILGGLGLLLQVQLSYNAWSSWAYAWALLPAFVAIGLLLAFLRSRTMRVVSLSMLAWSMAMFIIFAIFFAADGALLPFWPVILILAGLIVLVQSLLLRRPRQHA